ncbi:hypothetical protein BGP78_00195 [Pseudoalteromonas sp. MSK9-3]|uniref:DUF58 domain-containing protein n=1 Tax=Pseudoalteromonas sp. MSK9-3 TaxID=1897633 RepID=UPI000E6C4CA6|nr:DUF58 domain-containing protein [Pseudoalteromonas sp. MSK9-3]RJE77461.1 hypothetical protein BGP78_00195 [Pseudoalteromonas sp. MSK9-3]
MRSRIKYWFAKHVDQKHTADHMLFKHDSIYVLPSQSGLLFIGIMLLNFILGINYQNNLILAVSYIMGVLLVVSLLSGYINFNRLGLKLLSVNDNHEGVLTGARLELESTKERYNIIIKHIDTGSEVTVSEVFKNTIAHVALPYKRGVYTIGRFKIISHFPFGLVTVWSYLHSNKALHVYPLPKEEKTEIKHIFTGADGDTNVNDVQAIDEFNELKPYQQGMSLNKVSWRHFAKNQQLLVKDYTSEQPVSVGFDFDLITGNVEERLSKLCFLVVEASNNQQPFALKLPNATVPIGTGQSHRVKCLEILSEY